MAEQLSFDFAGKPAPPAAPRDSTDAAVTLTTCSTTPLEAGIAVPAPALAASPAPGSMPKTLADLEALLRQRETGSRKTADMCSALRTTAKVLGMPLDAISTCAAQLNPLLAHANPLAAGVSPTRWSRVKSLLLSALVAGGLDVLPSRDLQGFSPQWQALADQLPDKRSRVALSRLMSYFSRQGIAPKDVTKADIDAFKEALRTKSLRANPDQVYRSAIRARPAAGLRSPRPVSRPASGPLRRHPKWGQDAPAASRRTARCAPRSQRTSAWNLREPGAI